MKNIKEFKRSSNGLLIPNQDIVFQALFGTKGSEKILSGFLSCILGEKVDNISLDANQNLTREEVDEKCGIVDLRANVGNESTVHIEVQMIDPHNMFKRLLWYWARIYGRQLKNAENYSKLKKTIAILIANYDIRKFESFEDAHTKWGLLEQRNLNIRPFEDIEIHILELPKILKNHNATKKDLRTWLEFLLNPESEEVMMSKEEYEELNEAYEKLGYISEDEELRRRADLMLMAILDENSKREAREEQEERIRKGQAELQKGQDELQKGQDELQKGQDELQKGQDELQKGQDELQKGQDELQKGQDELQKGQDELQKNKEELAKNLLEMNLDINEISKITKLSIEQIQKLNS